MIRTVPAAVQTVPTWLVLRQRGASAADLLRAVGVRNPPIDVAAIAQGLGVWIEERSGLDCSGMIESTKTYAKITLNKDDHPLRKRFTIAHELGHLMLHGPGMNFRDEDFAGSLEEREANRFAADLLMPLSMVDAYANHLRGDVRRLAKTFRVSEQAMKIRLGKLVGF